MNRASSEPANAAGRWKVAQVVEGQLVEKAVDVAAAPRWQARADLRLLNHDLPRVDGPAKVTGRARYTHDVRLSGMKYGRLLRCARPSASCAVDLAPALALPGVRAALAIDDGETRFLGQPIAAVAADTPELAEDAIRAIAVELTELPWAVTREQTLAEQGAPIARDGNVGRRRTDGDLEAAEAALAACEVTVEATYEVPVQHHVCLETHGVVVDFRGGDEATIFASTQWTHVVHREGLHERLGLEGSQVEAVVDYMGGGFGSKFPTGIEGRMACELAKELGAPVHMMLTRRDEFLFAGNRSGTHQSVRAGAGADGKLKALIAHVDKLGGVGQGSHPGLPYIYDVETSYLEMRSVLTNLDSNRAMRAPGHPQASFAMESTVDALAHGVGMDGLAFRVRNLSSPVHHRQLAAVAKAVGWEEHPNKIGPDVSEAEVKTGIGFGVSTWGVPGRKACVVTVRIHATGAVEVLSGTQDLGTGTRTYVAAIVAEELGLSLGDVEAKIGHSSYGAANGSGGSTTVPSLAPAVKDAAHRARVQFLAKVGALLDTDPERLALHRGQVINLERGDERLGWSEACAVLGPDGLTATGEWVADLTSAGVHGAQAARVRVDTLTGEVKLEKIACMQDCGLPLNRLAVRSQINGALVAGLSYGLFEERVVDPDLGVMLNASLGDYKIAGCADIPEIVALIDDEDTRGALGIGEPPVIPTHSAIANAIFNACGVRLNTMPFTCDKVLNGLLANGTWAGGEA